jgi:hypothetical protein
MRGMTVVVPGCMDRSIPPTQGAAAPFRRREPRAALRRSATHGDRRPGGLSIAAIGSLELMAV